MKQYISILRGAPLFSGISSAQLEALLPHLRPHEEAFETGDFLLHKGDTNKEIGILLTGCADAFHYINDGTKIPSAHLCTGSVFGDVLGGASIASPVSIVANKRCTVLFFPYDTLLSPVPEAQEAHRILLQNLLRIISDKYFALSHRIDFLVLKTLRAKLCAYLLSQAQSAQSDTFSIPFTRAQLADYLGCERSALCRTLGKLQQEGLLETYRNSFKLLDLQELYTLQ